MSLSHTVFCVATTKLRATRLCPHRLPVTTQCRGHPRTAVTILRTVWIRRMCSLNSRFARSETGLKHRHAVTRVQAVLGRASERRLTTLGANPTAAPKYNNPAS